ncbi:MAG: DEAD/DEAH box helicase [Nitrososphaeraceae archaeon]|nr:DEAD/DEAH box helicase [Nitrososphaeraceae archaeon]
MDIIVNNSPSESTPSTPYVSHLLVRNRSIESRLYQKNIAETASHRNTMVILPTALGKTVISLLVAANMLYNYRDRRILVMAPTRPLISQHIKFFSSALKIFEDQISAVTGKTSPDARSAVWNKKDIRLLFATPEVVKNDLEEGRMHLGDFSLLVFDEAHRAVKDYAYTSIAKKYVSQSSNPLILAMTASPGAERKRMQEVCDNLFIEHIEHRSEDEPDVKQYVNPIDIKWEWFNLPEDYLYVISLLRSMLDERLRWLVQRGIIRRRGIDWIFKRDLIEAGESLRYALELTMEEQRGPLYIALRNQSSALTLMHCLELMGSQGSYSLGAFLDRIEKDEGKVHATLLKDPRIMEIKVLVAKIAKEHPKIERLVELVKVHHLSSDNLRGCSLNTKVLVFTQYRDTARHITDVLSRNGIKSSRFVGQAKREGDPGMKQEEQATILESFRNGDFDVLVATSIAEEGLDIPEVSLVIFYEPIASEIRYIQRKGRTGRKTTGSVIILAANNTIDTRYYYASQKRIEKMKNHLNIINTTLKSINRMPFQLNPMTPEELSVIEKRQDRFDEHLYKAIQSKLEKGKLSETELENRLKKVRDSKIQSEFSIEADLVTGAFRRQVYRAARQIHSELAKAGMHGIDVQSLHENLAFEHPVLLEALKKLEKLKRIEWLNERKIIIVDSLKKSEGEVYDVYIEKIVQGKALALINDKWHARLNNYDYEGPRDLLRSGSLFKAIADLYRENGVLNIRIKQIV